MTSAGQRTAGKGLSSLTDNQQLGSTGTRKSTGIVLPCQLRTTCRQLIVRETVVLCVTDPDVPFTVSVCVPLLAFLPTVTVTVACAELVPLRVTGDGEILQVVLPGAPLQESETFPVRPPIGDSVKV